MNLQLIPEIKINEENGVYSPDEDSYLLIDLIDVDEGDDILEIGCGTGIISLHCAYHGGVVTAVDINDKALELTMVNAKDNEIPLKKVLWSDMFSNISGIWDTIIFNPPYLPSIRGAKEDPRWDGGTRGDETIVRFLDQAYPHLTPGGKVYFCCSDLAPLTRIYNTIEMGYEIIEQREKTFDFESIFGFALMAINYNDTPFF